MRRIGAALMLATAFAGCGGDGGGIEVTDARIGQPTGPNAALYLAATANEEDVLLGARTEVASTVQIHESTIGGDGTMGMRPVESIVLPAGTRVALEPGGLHLMLLDVERLQVGDEVVVTLVWENAGEQPVTAVVVAPDDVMDHGE